MKNISLLFSLLFVLSCSNDSPDDINNDGNNGDNVDGINGDVTEDG